MDNIYVLAYEERPNFGMNKERTVHHMVRAKWTKAWRGAFCELAKDAMLPSMSKVEITIQPYVLNARYRQDVCFGVAPLAKAAIDGLIDAGVLLDDNANVVVKLTFMPAIYGRDALELTITDISLPN